MRVKAFTLVEMAVVTMIIGLLAVAITAILVGAQRSWVKQTKEAAMVRDLRWAVEYIANDIRKASAAAGVDDSYYPGGSSNGNGINFINSDGEVWYWCADAANADNPVGRPGNAAIYRALGSAANDSVLLRFYAANNTAGVPIFSYDTANSLVTICLTAQPRLSGNASAVMGNFTLRTKVRLRNQ